MTEEKTSNCWATIGVWGQAKPRCEILQKVVHCRNCEEFRNAGKRVFDKEIFDTDLKQWAEKITKVKEDKDKYDLSLLTFRLGSQWYAFPTRIFLQISPLSYTHEIPHKSHSGLKLVNVAGALYISFDLSEYLVSEKNPDKTMQNPRRYMLINIDDTSLVLPVDQVGSVYRVDSKKISKEKAVSTGLLGGAVQVDGEKCYLINLKELANLLNNALDLVL